MKWLNLVHASLLAGHRGALRGGAHDGRGRLQGPGIQLPVRLFALSAGAAGIVDKINRDVSEALRPADAVERFFFVGADPLVLRSAAFNELVKADEQEWGGLARASGARVE